MALVASERAIARANNGHASKSSKAVADIVKTPIGLPKKWYSERIRANTGKALMPITTLRNK